MKRYTWIDKDDGIYVDAGDIGWIEYEIGHKVYCGDAIDKLAEYENTGYTPKEFDNLCRLMSDIRIECGFNTFEELREYIHSGGKLVTSK